MRSVLHVLYAEDSPTDSDLTRSHFARHAPDIQLDIAHFAEDFLRLARTRPGLDQFFQHIEILD